MNLIVAKTRKNDVSNTNGVFAAARETVHGPATRCKPKSDDLEKFGLALLYPAY